MGKKKREMVTNPAGDYLDDWLGILELHAVQEGLDLGYAKIHGGRLIQDLTAALDPDGRDLMNKLYKQYMKKFRLLPTEVIRDFIVRAIQIGDSAEIDHVVRNLFSYRRLTGEKQNDSEGQFLKMTPEEVGNHLKDLSARLEALPLESWDAVKHSILSALQEISTNLERAIQGELKEILAFATWHMEQQMLSDIGDVSSGTPFTSEYQAVVYDREVHRGWRAGSDEAFLIVNNSLRAILHKQIKKHGYFIPGERLEEGNDSYPVPSKRFPEDVADDSPHSEEFHMLQIGILRALRSLREQRLSDSKQRAKSGQLRYYFMAAALHSLFREIDQQCSWRGIKKPKKWNREGMTEEDIRRREREDIEGRASKEIPDFEIETADGKSTTLLERESAKESHSQWIEDQVAAAKPNTKEKIQALAKRANLTPRQTLVVNLWDWSDKQLAKALEDRFHKPVKLGAVRKLRHDTRKKLKLFASGK